MDTSDTKTGWLRRFFSRNPDASVEEAKQYIRETLGVEVGDSTVKNVKWEMGRNAAPLPKPRTVAEDVDTGVMCEAASTMMENYGNVVGTWCSVDALAIVAAYRDLVRVVEVFGGKEVVKEILEGL